MRYYIYAGIFVLCSCSTATTMTAQPTDFPSVRAPELQPLALTPFNWTILNDQKLKQLAASLPKTPGNHIILFSLDSNNYMIFDSDLLELQRYIEEQNQTILFYKALEENRSNDNKKQK